MTDETELIERIHVQPEWTEDLTEDFKEKYSEIASKLALYDEMLISIMKNESDMSSFYRCMDRIVNRYLPKQFKEDIDKICMRNFCVWAMPYAKKRYPVRFYRESLKAYRFAVLSFMPNVVKYLQAHPVVLKLTVE